MTNFYNENNYFYDEQFRRYILQFIRLFGGLLVKTGKGRDNTEKFIKVPCRYADMQRMVGHILQNNSENVIKSCPFITTHILTLQPDRTRTLNPRYTDAKNITEREFNAGTGEYTQNIGNRYTVERLMPVPYTLTMQIDVWTSNSDQKLQILEQILVLFNPSIDLQTSTNILDWSSLTVVELTDINWSSRGVPQGTDSQIELASMTFTMPILINPPTKVTYQKLIQQIVTRTQEVDENNDIDDLDFLENDDDTDRVYRQIFIPENAAIQVITKKDVNSLPQIKLLTDNNYSWVKFLSDAGGLDENTQVELIINSKSDNNIIGHITETDIPNIVNFNIDVDTLPATTLDPVNAIIDPYKNYPGDGVLLANDDKNNSPENPFRYLILNNIKPPSCWNNLVAKENDIIEYNRDATDINNPWIISFTANHEIENTYYIKNLLSEELFKWDSTNQEWNHAFYGKYNSGYFKIIN